MDRLISGLIFFKIELNNFRLTNK